MDFKSITKCMCCTKQPDSIVVCDGIPMCQECFDDYIADHPDALEFTIYL